MKTATTDEEKRIVIAEYCGWEPEPRGWYNNGLYQTVDSLPDFLNSLDAMHEAEENLTYDQRPYYILNLKKVMMSEAGVSDFDFAHATARQRAEAFLKTIQQP